MASGAYIGSVNLCVSGHRHASMDIYRGLDITIFMEPIIVILLLVLAMVGGLTGGPTMFVLVLIGEGVFYGAVGPWEAVLFGAFACIGSWAHVYFQFWSNKRMQRRQQEAQARANTDFESRTKAHKR